ncbi:MAG TPA: thiamine-phosphate kinase [Planctomycetaceae bacterium]|nr:thiamine-phosphate kinase [Planctomycetaceae bacterium]
MPRDEFAFIDRIRLRTPLRPPVRLGIGDDAAVLDHPAGTVEVVTTDLLMEGVDFLWPQTSAVLIGRKSLAVNLSDLAAMAARPTAAFVSLALPRQRGRQFADELMDGLLTLADEFDVTLAGGDTNSWDGPLVVSVTVLGTPFVSQPILRSGARPGDCVFVTGACGGSLAGRHLTFTPRVTEAARLTELVPLHAMIDISDGLAADLHHVLDESRVGAVLNAAAIPIHADVEPTDFETALNHALSDGEDFELLFTIAAEDCPRLLSAWDHATPLTQIGTITAGIGCRMHCVDGSTVDLPPLGWSHPFCG